MTTKLLILFCTALLSPLAAHALQPIWNFDQGHTTVLDGKFKKRWQDEGKISMRFTHAHRRGEAGRALEVAIAPKPHDYSFIYMELFDSSRPADQRVYLTASGDQWLSFWVKGAVGGEQFEVKLADSYTIDDPPSARDDAGLYTPAQRLTTQWQEVTVKLAEFDLPSAKKPGGLHLASLVIFAPALAQGTIYIDDISIKDVKAEAVPQTRAIPPCHPQPARALWVWESRELMLKREARQDFFAFCRKHHIRAAFVQHLWQWDNANQTFALPDTLADSLGVFLAEARAHSVRIHALAGDATKALREHHANFFKLVDALVAYNQSRPAKARFSGLRLDVEPYTLPVFESFMKEEILREYLTLIDGVGQRLQGRSLSLGVDIPHWLHQQRLAYPAGGGPVKNAVEHLLANKQVDNIGVMAYRNTTSSPDIGTRDNIIGLARPNFDLAQAAGKQVYIGVETFRNCPTPVYLLRQIPAAEWDGFVRRRPDLVRRTRMGESPCPQCRINRLEDAAGNHYLGLARHPDCKELDFAATLGQFIDLINARSPSGNDRYGSWDLTALGPNMNEFSNAKPFVDLALGANLPVSGYTVEYLMGAKTTFADQTSADLHRELGTVEETFGPSCSFAGMVIHSYKYYRTLVNK